MSDVDVNTLRNWLDERRAVTVLDVRPREDREEWWIPGSVHVDAYEALNGGGRTRLPASNCPPKARS